MKKYVNIAESVLKHKIGEKENIAQKVAQGKTATQGNTKKDWWN